MVSLSLAGRVFTCAGSTICSVHVVHDSDDGVMISIVYGTSFIKKRGSMNGSMLIITLNYGSWTNSTYPLDESSNETAAATSQDQRSYRRLWPGKAEIKSEEEGK